MYVVLSVIYEQSLALDFYSVFYCTQTMNALSACKKLLSKWSQSSQKNVISVPSLSCLKTANCL